MNKISVVGRLTKDVEMCETTGGIVFCKFNLASRSNARDEDGKPKTDFFQCTAWRNNAENLQKYTKKGSQLYVTGSMQSRQYEKDEKKNTVWELQVDTFEFMQSADSEESKPKAKTGKKTAEELTPTTDEGLPF